MVGIVVQGSFVVVLLLITVVLLVQVVRSYTVEQFWRGVRDGVGRLGLFALLVAGMAVASLWIHAHIPLRDTVNFTYAVSMLAWIGGNINAHIWRKRQS